jgi:hypothetical protein
MNRGLTFTVLFIAVVGGAFFLWRGKTSGNEPLAAEGVVQDTESEEVLGVEPFMRAVDNYRGPVRLEGAVSAVVPEDQALTIIDVGELERCGVVTCAPLYLPVRWDGDMPAVGDIVRLRGEIGESENKLIFIAGALERVEQSQTEAP